MNPGPQFAVSRLILWSGYRDHIASIQIQRNLPLQEPPKPLGESVDERVSSPKRMKRLGETEPEHSEDKPADLPCERQSLIGRSMDGLDQFQDLVQLLLVDAVKQVLCHVSHVAAEIRVNLGHHGIDPLDLPATQSHELR